MHDTTNAERLAGGIESVECVKMDRPGLGRPARLEDAGNIDDGIHAVEQPRPVAAVSRGLGSQIEAQDIRVRQTVMGPLGVPYHAPSFHSGALKHRNDGRADKATRPDDEDRWHSPDTAFRASTGSSPQRLQSIRWGYEKFGPCEHCSPEGPLAEVLSVSRAQETRHAHETSTVIRSGCGGGGGIRTHGARKGHNGFRDRPVRPLRHPSTRSCR